MSIHQLSRQQAKRDNQSAIIEQLDEMYEADQVYVDRDAEETQLDAEDERRMMIVGGVDPDTLKGFTNLDEFEHSLKEIEFIDSEEQESIRQVRELLSPPEERFDIDIRDYFDDL